MTGKANPDAPALEPDEAEEREDDQEHDAAGLLDNLWSAIEEAKDPDDNKLKPASDLQPPEDKNQPPENIDESETFRVNADREPLPASLEIAERVFGGFGGMLQGVQELPDERNQDYRNETFHERTVAMVNEFLKYDNRQAFLDLRAEAGRPEWTGTSSVAPTAYHRCAVVKAIRSYEEALKDGDKVKQSHSLTELLKLRALKLGEDSACGQVHQAIDKYLERHTKGDKPAISREMLNEGRRRAQDGLTLDFANAATAFTAFALAHNHKERLAAFEAFSRAVDGNSDNKLVQYAARMGDYVSALHLKDVLTGKPTKEAILEATRLAERTSPWLIDAFLDKTLQSMKADPATKELAEKLEKLKLTYLEKLLNSGDFEKVLPHLKKTLESEEFTKIFKEYQDIRTSKHSAADLLRVGPHDDQNQDKKLEDEVEFAQRRVQESNRQFQQMERKFLERGRTSEERAKLLEEMEEFLQGRDVAAGDTAGVGNTHELRALNHIMSFKETDDPKKAAGHLEDLQKMASAGYPYAQKLLDSLTESSKSKSADELIAALKKEGADAATLLKTTPESMRFLEDELNGIRVRNLTYEFKSDRVPTAKELDELESSLKEEAEKGNQAARQWLEWTKAAKLMAVLPVGSMKNQQDRIKAIESLGELAKAGNPHAHKMLLSLLVAGSEPRHYGQWRHSADQRDNPPVLRPNLPKEVPSYRQQLADAALKATCNNLEANPERVDRSTAMALALALGQAKFDSDRERIDRVLKAALGKSNAEDVFEGLFDVVATDAPGGDHIAKAMLHGANLENFAGNFRSYANWAASGDSTGMVLMAGILAGRREKPDLIAPAAEIALKAAEDKTLQPLVLEKLLAAYQDGTQYKKKLANYAVVETMGDVLAKQDKSNIPEQRLAEIKQAFHKELKAFDDKRNELKPEDIANYEQTVRGFLSMSKFFDMEDMKFLKVDKALASALREKNWELPEDVKWFFKEKIFAGVRADDPIPAVECFAAMERTLTAHDLNRFMNAFARPISEPVQEAQVKALLQIIGANGGRQDVKEAAINLLEKSGWYTNKLNAEVRECLSEYVRGRVGDLKALDQVMKLVGDCGIEPPAALVVSRLGLPLNQELIKDVEAGLRNFNGDKAAYIKVLERAIVLNALPPNINMLGRPELPQLVKAMAQEPLGGNPNYDYLTTDEVEKYVELLQTAHYQALIDKTAEAGEPPLTRQQIRDSIYGEGHGYAKARALGSSQNAYDQSLESLRTVTREGHQTSYWWLAAGGGGYLIKRFGPGGTEEKFAEKQAGALNQWKDAQKALGQSMVEREGLINGILKLDMALDVGRYVQLVADGKIKVSDEKALKILDSHGEETLAQAASFIYQNLYGTAGKPGEIWARLKHLQVTNLEEIPDFRRSNHAGPALDFLTRKDLTVPRVGGDKYAELNHFAHNVAINAAFKSVDSDPRMTQAIETFATLAALQGQVQMLFHDGMAGYRAEDYTKFARDMSRRIEATLDKLKREAPEMRSLLKEMREARDKATDKDAIDGLNARIKRLEDILIGYVPNSQGETNSLRYKELKEMCRVMQSADFNPASFGKWLTDNAGTMILVTTALAGIALMPFSGGASGILTAVAVAALVATLGYVANEAWKAGMHEWGGAAYGSDFFDSIAQLAGGKERDLSTVRYDPKTGNFIPPPGMDEVFAEALKEIGKETVVNLLAAGFGKFLGAGLKAFASPVHRLAAKEITADSAKLVTSLEKVAASNPATRNWGSQFMRAWVSQIPWAVVGATSETVIQDSLKPYRDQHGVVEFMGHVAAVCFTVFTHRVSGHFMQPKIMRGGACEIPYDKAKFLEAMRKHYDANGKTMPEMVIEGDVAKVKVGGRVLELRFVDPAKVAAALEKNGVKPQPLQPGEMPPGAQPAPEYLNKLRDGTLEQRDMHDRISRLSPELRELVVDPKASNPAELAKAVDRAAAAQKLLDVGISIEALRAMAPEKLTAFLDNARQMPPAHRDTLVRTVAELNGLNKIADAEALLTMSGERRNAILETLQKETAARRAGTAARLINEARAAENIPLRKPAETQPVALSPERILELAKVTSELSRRGHMTREQLKTALDEKFELGDGVKRPLTAHERQIALAIWEHAGPNINPHRLAAQMEALLRQIPPEAFRDIKGLNGQVNQRITVYTLDATAPGNLLAHIFRSVTGKEVAIKVLDTTTLAQSKQALESLTKQQENLRVQQETLKRIENGETIMRKEQPLTAQEVRATIKKIEALIEESQKRAEAEGLGDAHGLKHALIFDDLRFASPEQVAFLNKIQGLIVADSMSRGITPMDVSFGALSGSPVMQNRMADLIKLVNEHPLAKTDPHRAAMEVLYGKSTKLDNPKATHYQCPPELRTTKPQPGSPESVRLEKIYQDATAPLLTPEHIKQYLGWIEAEYQRAKALGIELPHTLEQYQAAALVVARNMEFNTYPVMMNQARDVHAKIMQQVGAPKRPDGSYDSSGVLFVSGSDVTQTMGSQYAMTHVYARANGLGPANYITMAELRALSANPAKAAVLQGKRLVFLDDYANSGTQQARMARDAFTQVLGKLGIKELTVASLGKHQVPVGKDPWVEFRARYPDVKINQVAGSEYPSLFSQGNLAMRPELAKYADVLRMMRGDQSQWSDSSIQSYIMHPYGGPNNNPVILQYLARMLGPGRIPDNLHIWDKPRGADAPPPPPKEPTPPGQFKK